MTTPARTPAHPIRDPLVDKDGGIVSRRIFVDHRIYERELCEIFAKTWLLLGHESQLAKPDAFFTAYMGEEPVLVTRTRDGAIRAHLNTCRHRGMRICRAESGNAKTFTCPYHAWTYSNDGRLAPIRY